jgi:CHAD domain-containing protein
VTWKKTQLTVDPGFRRPSFAGNGLRLTASSSAVTTTTHYDTEDLRLARWQCTLRRAPRSRWIVGVEGRDVETFPGGDEPPDDAVAFLIAYLRGARLVPLVTVRTATRRLTMQGEGGVVLRIDDERTDSVGERVARRVRRLTVSAPQRARKQASAVVRLLRDAGARAGAEGAEHLAAAGVDPPLAELTLRPVSERSSVGDAIRGALGASVLRLIRNDSGVRLGSDPEAVHQARVATRRLRSDLQTFRSLLDRPWVDELRGDLSELADELGSVRDADVLLERLVESAKQLDDSDGAARVLDVLRAARQRDHDRLIATMETTAYARLLDRLVAAAVQPSFSAAESDPAPEVLPPRARSAWRRVKRRVRALPDQPSDDQLHEIRIAAKRARYAAEAVAPTAGPDAEHFAQAMADLQTHLGDLHDAVVAADWLRRHTGSDPRDSLAAGELIGMQLQRAAELRNTWPQAWYAASRKSLRRWMR